MSKIQDLAVTAARPDLALAETLGGSAVREPLDLAIGRATDHLLRRQQADGHWVFELEADATIPAEYLMLRRFFGKRDPAQEVRIGRYLRRIQMKELDTARGGWPLFHGGPIDISCSVKAYFALRLIGDRPEALHMSRAREAILRAGGAERSNVFTRATLALFGQVPWHAVPVMPPEICLLPRWFPFHLSKVSYWARTVLVPLTVVMARRPVPLEETGVSLRELFRTPPEKVRRWPGGAHAAEPWRTLFGMLDGVLQRTQHLFPASTRARAEAMAEAFVTERLNGEDGLGAIYPAMANAIWMYHCLGVPADDPRVVTAWAAVEKLVMDRPVADPARREDLSETYVQPCLSPIWDTALVSHALLEAGGEQAETAVMRGLSWLLDRQVTDVAGDWAEARPGLVPGGWAFQYANPHYPDVDDTAAVVLALDRAAKQTGAGGPALARAVALATDWVLGMQSEGGGWGAFDADNTHHHLNSIPFADHGALLDPPTADVSGRCLAMLAQLGHGPEHPAVRDAVGYMLAEQEPDGSWYGRWGVNYVYGTWSAVTALNAAGLPPEHPAMRKAVAWLKAHQNEDGGWGEDGLTYPRCGGTHADADVRMGPSTASQTAWALLALMACGAVDEAAVDRGALWLLRHQEEDGSWPEEDYTGTGFPRVFYLRYHGYAQLFPLWALARLRNLRRGNSRQVLHGL